MHLNEYTLLDIQLMASFGVKFTNNLLYSIETLNLAIAVIAC